MTREEEIDCIIAELDKVAPMGAQGRMLIAPLIRLAEIVKQTKPAEPLAEVNIKTICDSLDTTNMYLKEITEVLSRISCKLS